jgi:TonB family protein
MGVWPDRPTFEEYAALTVKIMSDSPIHVVPPPVADLFRQSAGRLASVGDIALMDEQHNLTALHNIGNTTDATVLESAVDEPALLPSATELGNLTWPHPLSPQEAAELAWLAETHRIIVLRLKQWVIPVSGLLSFLVAVLIEVALVGAIWWMLHWHLSGGGGNRLSESGSSTAIGGIIQTAGLNSLPSNPTKRWRPGPLPAPPNLPNKPMWKPHTDALALLDNTNPFHATLPLIGINSSHNAWIAPSHILAPKTVHTQISVRNVPGQRTRGRGLQPDSRGPQPDAAGGGGDGGIIQLFKHGAKTGLGSATGGGPGRGRGAGVGGGGSIVKPPPNPIMPLKYQFAWPKHLVNPKFQLTILPDGNVAAVKVLRSSGHPTIDQAIIDALMQARFLPDIVGGKPVQSKFVIRYNLSS